MSEPILRQHAEQALLDRGHATWSLAVAEDNSAKNLYSNKGILKLVNHYQKPLVCKNLNLK